MQTPDTDIAELERLLGGARAEYRQLTHEAELRLPATVPRKPRSLWPMAAAASVLLVVSAMVVGAVLENAGPKPSRLAFSRPASTQGLLPTAQKPPSITVVRPQVAVRLRSPRPPRAGQG